MHQSAPGKPYVEPNITIKGQRLKVVEKFTYLGNVLSKSIVMDDEMNTRLAKASAAFGQLNRNAWNRRAISEATKIKVYRAVVLTTLLYGCETQKTTQRRHVLMKNHYLPMKLLYGELSQGKRSHGGQKKLFKDTEGLHAIFWYHS